MTKNIIAFVYLVLGLIIMYSVSFIVGNLLQIGVDRTQWIHVNVLVGFVTTLASLGSLVAFRAIFVMIRETL